jgi:hypothetical protein
LMKNMSPSQGPGKGYLIQNWVQKNSLWGAMWENQFRPLFSFFLSCLLYFIPSFDKAGLSTPSLEEHFMDNPLVLLLPLVPIWECETFQISRGVSAPSQRGANHSKIQAHHQHQLQLYWELGRELGSTWSG